MAASIRGMHIYVIYQRFTIALSLCEEIRAFFYQEFSAVWWSALSAPSRRAVATDSTRFCFW